MSEEPQHDEARARLWSEMGRYAHLGFQLALATGLFLLVGWWLDVLSFRRRQLGARLSGLFGAGRKLDAEFYDELETVLLTSDVGVAASAYLLEHLRARVRREGFTEAAQLKEALREALLELLRPIAQPLEVSGHKPFVIMLAGVNG